MNIELFYQPADRLCAQIEGEKCFLNVKPVWAAPLSRPKTFLAILDAKGEDIALLFEPEKALSPSSWRAVELEMRRRNLTCRIVRLDSAREDNGAAYFAAHTDRGERDFVCTSLSTSAVWFGENRLLLTDTEGNRYEIDDLAGLDVKSQSLIAGIL